MKISVITVCYNAQKTIENTIQSVLNQTYQDIEYIVIDGASTDDTLSILQKYNTQLKYISEKDNGLYDAMNKGINLASGEYIMFLNADDKFYNDKVIENFAKECEMQKTDIVYGNLAFLKDGNISIQRHKRLNKIYLIKNTPQQPATFYKKSIFEKVGLFNTNFRIVADQEWFLRAFLKFHISSHWLDETVTIFSTDGLSNNPAHEQKHESERKKMFSMYFGKFEFAFYSFIAKYFRSLTCFPLFKGLFTI